MWLTGKTQIVADLRKFFIAVSQKTFCLFQFASGNEGTDGKSQFFFEFFHNIGITPVNVPGNVIHRNRCICMSTDIVHALVHFLGNSVRNLGLPAR